MKYKLEKISKILIIILPILMISGPLLPEIALTIIILSFLLISTKEEKIQYFKNNFFLLFVVFWLLLILISLLNTNLISFLKSISYLRFGLFFVSMQFFVVRNVIIFRYLFFCLGIVIIFLLLDGGFQFLTLKNFFGVVAIDHPRVSSIFGEEQILGSYVVRFLPIFLSCYYFLKTKNIYLHTFMILVFLASLIILVISGERMSILFGLLVSVFSLIFLIKKTKLNLMFFSLSAFLIVFAIFSNDNLKERIVIQTLNEFGLTDNKEYILDYQVEKPIFGEVFLVSPAHQSYFKTAYNMFKDRPFIGHGIKSFRIKCDKKEYQTNRESCSTHPHNIYIELLAETGFLSFFIILGLFIHTTFNLILCLIKKRNFEKYRLCLMCCFLISLWPIATTGSFFNNWLSIIFFFPLGLYANNTLNKKLIND